MSIFELVVATKACPTNAEVRRLIHGRGVKLNGGAVTDLNLSLMHGVFFVEIGKSKKYTAIIQDGMLIRLNDAE